MSYSVLKESLVPRAHSLCLQTTSSGVRVAALALMEKLTVRLDRREAERLVETCVQASGSTLCAITNLVRNETCLICCALLGNIIIIVSSH